MYKITEHPILDIPKSEEVTFEFNGQTITGCKGYTIAAALHQAGFQIHSHSIEGRERSLACGIGKCGACEMLVDGAVKRICITLVDDVKCVQEIPHNYFPETTPPPHNAPIVYKTQVVIIGAGPAGLACREMLNTQDISNIVIDNNAKIGGQFNMQTHQFFFFEKEKQYGGMRGFDIAQTLAGKDQHGIFLNSTVWDILEGGRIAAKNLLTNAIFYVDAEYLVVATGAVPFMPAFENDDLPGVYTAAVVQKMMNVEHTLLGKRILSIGAGNIGYLTSYQAVQAGAKVVGIVEAMDHEGGFPVQANRVRRLGIPIYTSHVLLRAIPNSTHTGIIGAVIAECKNFKPIPGTEKTISDIDIINICTGLIPDNQLLTKGREIFGFRAFGAGDAVRVGEGTCAVLRGKQVALEIAMQLGKRFSEEDYLAVSKQYIESQQRPTRILTQPVKPSADRMYEKGFVIPDCLFGFACNPCSFSCPQGAISKPSTSSVPVIDYQKCTGCMTCVSHCPGLAIFGYNLLKNWLFLPIEYPVSQNAAVVLINNQGQKVGNGIVEHIQINSNKTHVARVKATDIKGELLTEVTGFILATAFGSTPTMTATTLTDKAPTYVCHCEDVSNEKVLEIVANRKLISVDELKHTLRIGMGTCRGKRCIPRVKQLLKGYGIEVTGDATPRAPLSNQLTINEMLPTATPSRLITDISKATRRVECEVFVAGGGIAGSALFRYFSENGKKTVLCNAERGATWRCIGGGRPAFSVPEISDITNHNQEIFKELQNKTDIGYYPIRYVGFAHDDTTYRSLEASLAWSDGYMINRKDFQKEISPYFNPQLDSYHAALITRNCWQANPGRVVDYIRQLGIDNGGVLLEDCRLIEVQRSNHGFIALVYTHDKEFVAYHCAHFVNALGYQAATFAKQLGIETGLYPIKHQAFITGRLPLLGKDGNCLDMLIDRRNYNGFSAVYGQQFKETGQIIGCASPATDSAEAGKSLKFNSQVFIETCAEMFRSWIPQLGNVRFQAFWSGYYTEPRYIIDPAHGLLVGLQGHGFMMGQYLAKMYVDSYLGKPVPAYMNRLLLSGDGLTEKAFK